MAVREFIVNTHPRTYDWNIILKDDKKNTLAQIIIYKYLGARQSEPNVLTENKFFDDLYPRMMKLDFRNENKIVITFGLEATSDENYKKTKIEYDVNPILYNKILDYLRGLPIGVKTFRDGSTEEENHLVKVKLNSDNSSSASASASASNINRPYGGKRKSIKKTKK
jgi:hypothetical protein